MKKIELHVHLDGSVNPKLLYRLTKSKLNYKDFLKNIRVDNNCHNLDDYLEKFEIPLKFMQNKENLKIISYYLAKDLIKDNVIYAEIRFSPLLHTKEGLSFDDIITSILEGLNKSKLKTNLILCCMRGFSKEDNLKVIEYAKKYLNKGVCAIDLAGSESKYPNNLYKYIFDECNKLNIPYTIHSGESLGKESIELALDYGTYRLGHGINFNNDEDLIKKLITKNITLEVCPTSNINTNIFKNIKEHPVNYLYHKGVKITINTDNRTISNTTLNKEYKLLKKNFNLTNKDLKQMNKIAIEASFLSKNEKEELLKKI